LAYSFLHNREAAEDVAQEVFIGFGELCRHMTAVRRSPRGYTRLHVMPVCRHFARFVPRRP
jgi:DNA-directed RNA polymerase specialized sigma24 family protein